MFIIWIVAILFHLANGNYETLEYFKKQHLQDAVTVSPVLSNLRLKLEELERRLRSVEQPGKPIKSVIELLFIIIAF